MSIPFPKGACIPLLSLVALGACATQPAYDRPSIATPADWTNRPTDPVAATTIDRADWWTVLKDDAVDRLAAAALKDSPTLDQAAARVDQARAVLGQRRAQQLPAIGAIGNASRINDRLGEGTGTIGQSGASFGASLAWEIDLWGRVREGKAAAQHRLDARVADAEAARLAVVGDIADSVLALRSCRLVLDIRDRDIASRETELRIGRSRLSFGAIAPFAIAAAESNLATARAERIVQNESCQRLVDALAAFTGLDGAMIAAMVKPTSTAEAAIQDMLLPAPPPFQPALPATVLLSNPAVVAAEREVAARWSEIAVARAERLPRLDLTAMLTGQWLRAFGTGSTYTSNSIGVGLTAPIFDAGVGAANVRAAQAAYREAVAQLMLAVRGAGRDVEDGLAAQQSAISRVETTRDALVAARYTLRANEARWRAGAIAHYELEETRRQFLIAEEGVVVAATDRARVWVALVRCTGTASNDIPEGPRG